MTDADKIQKLKAHETDLLEQRFELETQQEKIESALALLNARLEEVRGALELFDDIDRARAAVAKPKRQYRRKAGADRLQAPAVLPDSAAPVGSEPRGPIMAMELPGPTSGTEHPEMPAFLDRRAAS